MSSSNPQPGDVLAGKYRIEQVLGVGGMGAVVAAHHEELDQKVAIKYLLPEALKNPEVVARFSREARAAAKIRGEHVARVIDVGKFPDGAPYMVMEYLEGHDLAKQLEKNGPLKSEDAVRHIIEACEALAQAHAAKIVHRDLKPANLFLAKQPGGRSIVKVLDFGISKVDDAASAGGLTKTSALMGTAYYMSPEQMMTPKGVDHRSDIWSLGVILYELLGGVVPFQGETVPEIVAGILSNEPRPLRELRPDIPGGLVQVVVKCMQTKVADRYASVARLAAALAPFASPSDRAPESVLAISRVLGDDEALAPVPDGSPASLAKTELPSAAMSMGPVEPVPPTALSPATPNSAITPQKTALLQTPMPMPTPVGAVTAQGMSTSAITPKKSSPAPMIAGGAALLVALGIGGFFAFGKKDQPPPAMGGLVETSAPPSSAAPAPSPLPSSTSLTVLAPLESASAVASASASPPGGAVATPRVTTATKILPVATSAKPAASAAPSAHPTTTAAATASAAPQPTSKNPLNMGIK